MMLDAFEVPEEEMMPSGDDEVETGTFVTVNVGVKNSRSGSSSDLKKWERMREAGAVKMREGTLGRAG